MPDFSTAITLLRKPIEDVYSAGSSVIQDKLSQVRTAVKMKNLHKKLWESQKVKTIWNTDRPLSLNAFFYPVHVSRRNGAIIIPTRLTSLDDLPDNHNIIFGTVGQGKSILLRYLLGKEMKSGTRIPVLCELRNVENNSLLDYLCNRFCLLLGLQKDLDLFLSFASTGKISFLLDGFDEIDASHIQKLMVEIEDLSFRFPLCRIVLTSRPESECRHLTNFYANKIQPLQLDDLNLFYKRVTRDDNFTIRLVSAIRTSPVKIRELVNTPLLATLLAISYRTAHKIPLDFAEFYDELFQILLVRHDGAKLGWRRARNSKLNDREIQQVFEAFCFATRKKQVSSFDRDTADNVAIESIKECKVLVDSQNFLDDIRKITCLLVDEGKKMHFVHASVQEFFSSRYIKMRSEPVAKKFYEQLLSGKWELWKEELQFLRQIDKHRSSKYFYVPDLCRTIDHFLSGRVAVDSELIEAYLSSLAVAKSTILRDGVEKTHFFVKILRDVNTHHYAMIDAKIFSTLFYSAEKDELNWKVAFANDAKIEARTYAQVARDMGGACYARAGAIITVAINSFVRERQLLQASVHHEESETTFMDIG
jgi:hypothetical protein